MKILIAVLIVIFLVLQYRLWVGEGSFANMSRLEKRVATQTEENEILEERNEALFTEVTELQTGMDAIEEHARNELGLIKDDEIFFLIVEDSPENSGSAKLNQAGSNENENSESIESIERD